MAIVEAIGLWLTGKLAEMALDAGAKGLAARLNDKAARVELGDIAASAIEAACTAAPSLAEDLRSQSFLEGAVLPTIVGLVEDPTAVANADAMVSRYIEMFVTRFAGPDAVDATLKRVFQADRTALGHAFETFFLKFKSALYASTHWKDAQLYRTAEQSLQKLTRIENRLDALIDGRRAAAVDLAAAERDATTASIELKAWPTEIDGVRLESPLLARLLAHLEANPAGSSLIIGEAGTGKSALFARLVTELGAKGVTTYGIKADLLPETVKTLDDLAAALGVSSGLEDQIAALAANGRVVLLIDQLDAVSEVMDRKSARMPVLLRLVHEIGERARGHSAPLAIHVLVSSRPFEADHDARFQRLGAERFQLGLLEEADIDTILVHLGLARRQVDAKLLETLRRPFALKLFVDIVKSGADISSLMSSNLLDRWLERADLGDPAERRECMKLLTTLAAEMIETETLWRPADAFDLDYQGAVRRCRASGLLVVADGALGFSHQSWLDDFQAKSHRTAASLAAYAWTHQDSLFVRGTILRALERQRAQDPKVYGAAIAMLLGAPKTRRHIKHLIADIIAANPSPSPAEAGWVDHWAREDRPLAQRALGKLKPRWPVWREYLRPLLPFLMNTEHFHWQAAHLLAAEMACDPGHAATLIERHWGEPEKDKLAFTILEQAAYIGPEVAARLEAIFARSPVDSHFIAQFIITLRTDVRFDEAARILGLWIATVEKKRDCRASIHQLEKLAAAAPLETAQILLPWFVEFAELEVDPPEQAIGSYARSRSLPWGWSRGHDVEQGSPFEALLIAIRGVGEQRPERLWPLLEPLASIENDDVHELIAVGLTAAGPALAKEALAYLLADHRRFLISQVTVDGGDGIMRSIEGWHSQQLVAAIAPGLDAVERKALMEAIEGWSKYPPQFMSEMDAASKRRWLFYAQEARYPLLEGLPVSTLGARRKRVIDEWREAQAPIVGVPNQGVALKWIGSAMSAEQMERARDADILRLLNEVHDRSRDDQTRPLERSGGIRALAQDFAGFGKAQPARAIAFARAHFEAGKHEAVAGSLVSELGRSGEAHHADLLNLILEFSAKGFASEDWRQSAGSALQEIAKTPNGLSDDVITLIETWLITDQAVIAARAEAEAEDRQENGDKSHASDAMRPLLFHTHGGFEAYPAANFTYLAAIASGCLCRDNGAGEAWLAALERHLERPEEPVSWRNLFLIFGRWLPRGEPRVQAILETLWNKYPAVFLHHRMIHFLWELRAEVPDTVLRGILTEWLAGDLALNRQAAAEFITGGVIVDPDSPRYAAAFALLDDEDEPQRVGKLFSAAAAWRETEPTLRAPAHAMLMPHLPTADGPSAHAISMAVDRVRTLVPDGLTRDMLEAMRICPRVLEASLNTRFIDGLQSLLYHPGFDSLVFSVTDAIADIVTAKGQGIGSGLVGQELVHVAIALQRSESPLRARAMDLYEKLLDAQIYGAEQAAAASLGR